VGVLLSGNQQAGGQKRPANFHRGKNVEIDVGTEFQRSGEREKHAEAQRTRKGPIVAREKRGVDRRVATTQRMGSQEKEGGL